MDSSIIIEKSVIILVVLNHHVMAMYSTLAERKSLASRSSVQTEQVKVVYYNLLQMD
jgi:phosphopantetheine adenylyltransferase